MKGTLEVWKKLHEPRVQDNYSLSTIPMKWRKLLPKRLMQNTSITSYPRVFCSPNLSEPGFLMWKVYFCGITFITNRFYRRNSKSRQTELELAR